MGRDKSMVQVLLILPQDGYAKVVPRITDRTSPATLLEAVTAHLMGCHQLSGDAGPGK